MTREERENAIRCLKLWIEKEPYIQTYKICLEALEQSMPTMVYPQVDGITPTVVAQADGEYITQSAGDEIRQKNYDLISRQAVLDLIVANHTELNGLNVVMYSPLYKDITQLPPVNPQEPKIEKVIKMRDATPEEQKSVDDYIKSISKPTGINFWNLDDNDDCISRKAVLSLLADHFDNVFDMVKELPSVAILPEHDGCKDCKYETYPEYYYPCCECKQNYVDEWQKKPHWIHRNDDYTDWLECPNCGYGSEGEVKYGEGTPFCPHCGERLEEK